MKFDPMSGRRLFTDGVTQPVYRDDRGQYVFDGGRHYYGRWAWVESEDGRPADVPLVVEADRGQR